MLIKKVFLIMLIVILLSLITNADLGTDNLAYSEYIRCIPNDKCEYFEDEISCPDDCNLEALERQRVKKIESKSLANNELIVDNNLNKTQKPDLVLVTLSGLFIILFFVFVSMLYSWVQKSSTKKHDINKFHDKAKASVKTSKIQDASLRRHDISKPEYLPKKPQRRL